MGGASSTSASTSAAGEAKASPFTTIATTLTSTSAAPTSSSTATATTASAAPPPRKPKKFGLAASVSMLRDAGALASQEIIVGRASDHRLDADINKPGDLFKLEYRDDDGHLQTTEQAFRDQQYKFRGQQPGAKKREKLQEQIKRDEAMLAMQSGDTPLGTASATKALLERTKTAGIVLSKR